MVLLHLFLLSEGLMAVDVARGLLAGSDKWCDWEGRTIPC